MGTTAGRCRYAWRSNPEDPFGDQPHDRGPIGPSRTALREHSVYGGRDIVRSGYTVYSSPSP